MTANQDSTTANQHSTTISQQPTTANISFIKQHLQDDVRQLALRKVPEGVDMPWCLQQIEGWQLAQKKLPRWTCFPRKSDWLCFPPRLSMEQCSSEQTARYKQQLAERLLPLAERERMADLTGGFGIDFSYLAPLFRQAVYVERQEELCKIARHNFPLLQLMQAEVVCGDSSTFSGEADLFFLDPARRDDVGRKTVAIADCTPNLLLLLPELLTRARYIIIKLSPMLDIAQALKELPGNVEEIHIVSLKGECKELLLVMRGTAHHSPDTGTKYFCTNLETEDMQLICTEEERKQLPDIASPRSEDLAGQILFEPNASVLKAGCQNRLCTLFGLKKLHPCSNLFVAHTPQPSFPGRQFRIEAASHFSKKELKTILSNLAQANLTTRNFPTSVADLRRKWHLKEGGDIYLFATTLANNTHALLRCTRQAQ